MRRSIMSFAAAILSAGWLLSLQPAAAQNPPAAPNVSDQQLDKTAKAIEHVSPIQKDYQEKLSKAAPDQREQLVDEANAAMQKAVTDQGLSVDEYRSIIELARNDPSVADRLVKRMGSAAK